MSARPGNRGGRWLLAGLLAASGLAGCKRSQEPCVITGVTVVEPAAASPLQPLGLDRDDLRRLALQGFSRTSGFAVPAAEPPQGAPRCRAGISLLDARLQGGEGAAHAEVLLRLDVAPGEEGDAIFETVRSAEAVRPGEPLRAAFLRAIEGGAARAAAILAMGLAESRKTDSAVIADLDSGDPRLRDLAVGVLADRKNPAAVPALLARLQDPDPDVADRAVGALGQIGDPRAVPALIELSRRRGGPFVAQMVRIIGDIGGDEATAYLETLAAGHPDPLVANAARQALQDARRRAAHPRSGEPPR